jgi:hypothetical protein
MYLLSRPAKRFSKAGLRDDTCKDTTFGLDDGSFPIPGTCTFIVHFDF